MKSVTMMDKVSQIIEKCVTSFMDDPPLGLSTPSKKIISRGSLMSVNNNNNT